MRSARVLSLSLVLLLLVAAMPVDAQNSGEKGRLVSFPLARFNDTLFTGMEPAYRVALDERQNVWYSSLGGVAHVDVRERTRVLYTKMDGLPSSLSLGVALGHGKTYIATDLGLAILDRASGNVTTKTPFNSEFPDTLPRELAVDGGDLWVGTHYFGVAIWNTTEDKWTVKNTSTQATYAKPVKRIVPTPTAVWVGTDGDGAWRYDRATQTWKNLRTNDGLLSNTVLAIAQHGRDVYFGTEKGMQRWTEGATPAWKAFTAADGLPNERVFDIDVVPTEDDTHDVFVSTGQGMWQFDPDTGANQTLAQSFGILGNVIYDSVYDAERGWAFATDRGVSVFDAGGWNYYATGASVGPSQGPHTAAFTSAHAGDSAPFLWFGTDEGLAAYLPPGNGNMGVWYNFAEWARFPGGPVNMIDVEGNMTWAATNTGVVGYDTDANEWRPLTVTNSRNLVYGLDADRDEIWIGLFGEGLIMRNLTTGAHRAWSDATAPQALPDNYVTDVRVSGNDVWVGTRIGPLRVDRVSGSLLGTYTVADGLPGSGITLRILPDGPAVWVGTKDGGIARLDVAQGKVTRVWNATATPGFPDAEIRSLYRDGAYLWVGTKEGLARIDVASGAMRSWNQTNSPLVQDFVNGISAQDGVLYLATLSGVARMNIATGEWYPMRDGPDMPRGEIGSGVGAARASVVTVRIDTPRDGIGVTGQVDIRGTASRFAGTVDRVEVKIGDGAWRNATGSTQWAIAWDTTTATPNEPVTIAARAVSGNETSRTAQVVVVPVSLPKEPLRLVHTPVESATAGRPFLVTAQVGGDPPVLASVLYRPQGASAYTKLDLTRRGSLHEATIPAKDVREGEFTYYLEARSGLLAITSPEDPGTPHRVVVGPPPSLAVALEAPQGFVARAGADAAVDVNVTNVGTEPITVTLHASGIRASWVRVSAEPIDVPPGETKHVRVSVSVPLRAFHDNTTIALEARDVGGQAEPAKTILPMQVVALEDTTTPATAPRGKAFVPAPGVALLLGAAALLALRRRPA